MDQLLFMRRFLSSPARVGSLFPSSRRLARRVAAALPAEGCSALAEFGPGTGRITEEMLRRLPAGSRLLLFEADPGFRRHLGQRFPGLPVYADARHLRVALAEQGLRQIPAVVSGIPFAVLPADARTEILSQVRDCLAPGGVFVAYQYTPNLYLHARQYFARIELQMVFWNLPPAVILRCYA